MGIEHRTSNVQHRTPKSNPKSEIRNPKSRALGQYFTPEPVVALCYRMLRELDPETAAPSIIDPACGEGAFLSYALEHGITTSDRLFGVEKDSAIAGTVDLPGINLFIGDGLSPSNTWRSCSPCPRVPASPRPSLASFDWVVGNPPFGTGALADADQNALRAGYTIWRGSLRAHSDLSRYPIEILFLERFVQLARPGGHIAIIIPDGILANARLSYVREWLWEHTEVKAVASLPQHTFFRHGAAAKASVLALRKREHPGVMECWSTGVSGSHQPSTPLLQYSISLPSVRLDPAYYHPDFVENARFLESLPNVVWLGELIEFTTYGAVGAREYAESGVRLITPANLTLDGDGFVVGVNVHNPKRFVREGSRSDPPRSRLRRGDLLLANSGVGCIGRAAVFHSDEPCNISQHINLIRLIPPGHPFDKVGTGVGSVEPEYLAVYLQTRFGRLQIEREKCGVGACGINFDRIRSILIPVLPEDVRREIVEGYGHIRVRELVERLESLISA